MMLGKIMAFFHLTAAAPRAELETAMRHARAAAFQHKKLSSSLQTASLDRIEEHLNDPRPRELSKNIDNLQSAMSHMLNDVAKKAR